MESIDLSRDILMKIAKNIMDLVGNTPILQLSNIVDERSASIFAKLEFLNPGGSVKDRAALGMLLDAERRGVLKPGATIIEATAGNTGVGLALIGISRGYKVVLFVPEQFAEEKCVLMRGFGATVIRTPREEGMKGAIHRAEQTAQNTQNSFAVLQFDNPANPDFHEQTTAVEIYDQLEGRIDALVLGAGTGGTFTGISRYLKRKNPEVITVLVESQGSVYQGGTPGPHRVEGIGASFIPGTFDRSVCDRIVMVNDEDAFAMTLKLARREGLLAGSSAGAAIFAAVELAKELGPGKRIATLIPDSAERYLSTDIFGEKRKEDNVQAITSSPEIREKRTA